MSAMNPNTTVVFADLAGSTGVYEALGNAAAAEAIARLTQWIGGVCQDHGGRVVKLLGDGVLAVFPQAAGAVAAVVALQRAHARQLPDWPNHIRMRLQIGVAAGEVIEVDGDCYGDAVNVASRLSDLSGPDHIWATRTVVSQLGQLEDDVRVRSLGSIPLRGRSQAADIFQVDWEQDVQSRHLTRPATLSDQVLPKPALGGGVRLSWLGRERRFRMADLPIHLGRAGEAEFKVEDQRVSRIHARIEWRNGSLALADMSSYGTWVRFAAGTVVSLRRDECALVGAGELALGAPFEDVTAPIVDFAVLAAGQ
jgi:adenylate cyclase